MSDTFVRDRRQVGHRSAVEQLPLASRIAGLCNALSADPAATAEYETSRASHYFVGRGLVSAVRAASTFERYE